MRSLGIGTVFFSAPSKRAERGQLAPLAAEFVRLDAEDVGEPLAAAVGIGDDRQLGARHVVKQNRLVGGLLDLLGDGGQLVLRLDLAIGHEELTPLA